MPRKWSKAYRNGYNAGKQGKRFPYNKWNGYSTGFKKGYSRGKSSRSTNTSRYKKNYRYSRYKKNYRY